MKIKLIAVHPSDPFSDSPELIGAEGVWNDEGPSPLNEKGENYRTGSFVEQATGHDYFLAGVIVERVRD